MGNGTRKMGGNPKSPVGDNPASSPHSNLATSSDDGGPKIPRRLFMGSMMGASTALVGGCVGAPPVKRDVSTSGSEFKVTDQKPWANQTRRLKITKGGVPVASLIFPTDYPTHFRLKPELHHVCTPRGFEVTGSHEYCFIHHMSVYCGHGKVQVDGDARIVDFYRHLGFPDRNRRDPHRPVNSPKNLLQDGPSGLQKIVESRWRGGERVVIYLKLAWQTREMGRENGDVLAFEERYYNISQQAGMTVVDIYSKLMPASRPLTLIPENDHGYLAVRVHDFIDPDDGGVMRDSEGRNPNGHFRYNSSKWVVEAGVPAPFKNVSKEDGPRPRWVDCTGKVGGETIGMTLMSHPSNVRNEWHAREFGLMLLSAAQTIPVRITEDQPFELAARYVAHDGPLVPAVADQLHATFSRTHREECREFLLRHT